MCKPAVGRTISQSSWHQRWNDRLQDRETPCQYRTGKIEVALSYHRDWVPEMPVLEELSQAAQAKEVKCREQMWTEKRPTWSW